MAVTIDATNMQLIDAADATTGWTSSMGSLGTATDSPREGGTNLSDQASQEQYQIYHTITSEDYSNRTIFGWQKAADPAAEADASGAGFGMYIGDGTNGRSYDTGGSDNYAFFFAGWSSWRLNTAGLPTSFIQNGGGAPTITALTQVGYAGQRTIKANGSTDNVNIDVLRYCSNSNPALLVEGGTTGDRGTWAEVTAQDENTSNAWGIIRSLVVGGKAFEVMFGLQIGSLDSTAYFDDADFQLFLNGQVVQGGTISAGSMDFTFVGGGAFTNVINFDNFFVQSVGAVSNWDASDTNIDELLWSNGQFVDMGTFLFQAQDAGNKTLTNLTWVNCGIVNFKGIDADGCTFNGASDANGAVEWDSGAVEENQDNLTFNSDGTGHAIYINIDSASLTTFNIDGYVFDGYAGQDGTAGNRVFYINNPSDGDITINLTNSAALNQVGTGSGFSYELAAGTTSTVSIVQTVTLQVTVVDADNDNAPIEDCLVSIRNQTTNALISQGRTNASGVYTDGSYNYTGDLAVNIETRRSSPGDQRYLPKRDGATITSNGLTQTVGLSQDPNAGIVAINRFDVAKQGQLTRDTSGASITVNLRLPAATGRKLVVAAGYWDATANLTVSSMTYDGNAMTLETSNFVQEGAAFHEAFLYRYDIPDTDTGIKEVILTLSASCPFRFLAFAVLSQAGSGAAEDSSSSVGQAVTTNPSITLNNTTQPAIDVMWVVTDDTDAPTATGVGSIRRDDQSVDGLKKVTFVRADRSTTGSHSLGADYGANSKAYVSVGATYAD